MSVAMGGAMTVLVPARSLSQAVLSTISTWMGEPLEKTDVPFNAKTLRLV